MYKMAPRFDEEWLNEGVVDKFVEDNISKFKGISNNQVYQINISGDCQSSMMEEKVEADSQNDFLNSFKKERLSFTKRLKKVRYWLAVTPLNPKKKINSSEFSGIEDPLNLGKLEPMNINETYNAMFNILNPDRASDTTTHLATMKRELNDASQSILYTLLKSYMEESDKYFKVGDMYTSQFIVNIPPAVATSYFSIAPLITHLSTLDSDFMINMMFRSDTTNKILNSRRIFAKGGVFATIGINKSINTALNYFDQYIGDSHSKSVAFSIRFTLKNRSLEKLYADNELCYTIPNWNGSSIVKNTFTQLPDYLAHLPGVQLKHRFQFVMTTKELMTALMLPNLKQDGISVFKKRGNIATTINFFDRFGGLIFAPPERGKSALMNYIYMCAHLQFKTKLLSLVIDWGGSYKSLAMLLKMPNMTYTTLSIDDGVFYNPLDLEFGKSLIDGVESVIERKIKVMISFFEEGLSLSDTEIDLLKNGLLETYAKYILDKTKWKKDLDGSKAATGIEFYVQKYEASNFTNQEYFFAAMPTLNDLISVISSSDKLRKETSDSVRKSLNEKLGSFLKSDGKIFSKKSTQYFLNDHLIVDLKEIGMGTSKNNKLLNLILIYIIQSKLLTFSSEENLDLTKVMMIDEYVQYNKRSPFIDSLSADILNTGRKEDIHLFLASQNSRHFPEELYNVAGHLIAFQPNSIDEIKTVSERTGLSMRDLKVMEDIKTSKNHYSEFAVITNNAYREKRIFQYVASPFDFFSFINTNSEDRALRDRLFAEYGNIEDAIAEMIRRTTKKEEED
ncbi:MAG: hypothetical protein HOG49_33400 [Candidatus Scalindua sp.]|nr:hypothetical protein [Candidatus Scalindua sp.]